MPQSKRRKRQPVLTADQMVEQEFRERHRIEIEQTMRNIYAEAGLIITSQSGITRLPRPDLPKGARIWGTPHGWMPEEANSCRPSQAEIDEVYQEFQKRRAEATAQKLVDAMEMTLTPSHHPRNA